MIFHPLLLFLDVSGGELLVIILVVFLVFGPQKMPEIARKIGKAMNEMKKASNDLTREFRQESSGLRKDIEAAQTEVKQEIGKVSQEVNQTRARVAKDLSFDQRDAGNTADASPLSTVPEILPDPPTETGKAG